ncbi:uncharacterized protein H6S33_001837 [Morchella sextelata]|uniref:uncharacterized protein n=1 Tax=Morchella sextelata TaxID=1174677 RepID=UPI001D055545|nr:uncharacterized protein H6S33_001837 [Morchella sextelata]KAH0608703.1 hypothetical protein H6S33_001837 [Morchella sextelata]
MILVAASMILLSANGTLSADKLRMGNFLSFGEMEYIVSLGGDAHRNTTSVPVSSEYRINKEKIPTSLPDYPSSLLLLLIPLILPMSPSTPPNTPHIFTHHLHPRNLYRLALNHLAQRRHCG